VSRFPADNPAHRRIMAQALGVVHAMRKRLIAPMQILVQRGGVRVMRDGE
jgi:hypothetical protein